MKFSFEDVIGPIRWFPHFLHKAFFGVLNSYLWNYACGAYYCYHSSLAQMEDSREMEDKSSEEVISDSSSQKKQETRDEMLSRHR